MRPQDLFRFCPRCGEGYSGPPRQGAVHCNHCGLLYHFNPATATAAFIFNTAGEALFIVRGKEPARGKLALPGGFVEPGESAETGLRRELREEVNLEVHWLRYLCSAPNQYHYQDVTYAVLDLFYIGVAAAHESAAALEDVQSYTWLRPDRVDPAELAFESMREALRELLKTGGAPTAQAGTDKN